MEDDEFLFEKPNTEEKGYDSFFGLIGGIIFFGSLIYLIIENGIFVGFIIWLFLLVIVVPAIFKAFLD